MIRFGASNTMKHFLLVLFLIPFAVVYAQTVQEDYTVAEFSWDQASFPIRNITATASIHVTDPDMNKFSDSTDTVEVFVYSDSYREGITILLYETEHNSGIFERTFGLSEERSAPNILYAREGDTITAKYVDTTLPPPNLPSEQLELTSTAFVGSTGPPLERAPASNARIMDSNGNSIDRSTVGKQVHFTSDIGNGMDREQEFTLFAQILDEQDKVVSLGWIDGVLNPNDSFTASISWIPEKTGQYEATMFVWESIDNPTALSPPVSIDFDVILEQNYNSLTSSEMKPKTLCQGNNLCLKEKVVKIIDGDTIYLTGGHKVRLSLVDTPEPYEKGFYNANQFTANRCPVSSVVTVDQDDLQPYDAYDRLLGKVICGDKILNEELLHNGHAKILTQYCKTSEFSKEKWAQEFGC